MNRLAGRKCIVTGATGALGSAVAGAFWSEGADLLLVGRSTGALAALCGALGERPNQQVRILGADLSHPDAPKQIVDEAVRGMGGLTVLVNNAARQGPIGPVWENDWREWELTLRVNFLAAVDLCRLAVPHIAACGGGKIVNISGGGATGPRPNFTAYGAAKAALVRFSESLAEETRPLAIDVNCIAPGPMNSAITEAILKAGSGQSGEGECQAALRVAAGGSATPDRAAALCVLLSSPESDGLTGKLISAVWDPWEMLCDRREELQKLDVYTLRRIVPADRGLDWTDK